MKRLLITTAVGLCLAAPAFAQSTTDQDQLNKQRTNQPSSSAPSSQTAPSSSKNMNQQGDMNRQGAQGGAQGEQPSPRAQAPSSNQNQRGQAQNERQPSDSSTNAQAPSSSSESSKSATSSQTKGSKNGQAQNKRQPSDSSTSAQAPSSKASRSGQAENRQMQQNDRQNARASRTDRASAGVNVNINDQQRTRIAAVIGNSRVRPVNVNFRLDVGVAVPRTVVLHTVPASIVQIVPEYRGYSYFLTRDEIVIVEPRRKTVVAVLPAGGTARAQATSDRVRFTDQQRDVIRSRASSLRTVETTGSATHYIVEEEIPATVELQEFPAEVVTEVPMVRTYRYFRQDNDVVVVDPTRRRVIEVIR